MTDACQAKKKRSERNSGKKMSRHSDSNKGPRDDQFNYYSPSLCQLSYDEADGRPMSCANTTLIPPEPITITLDQIR
jgi:hypothetical protein